MLRPLWVDLCLTLIPLVVAAAAWFIGRTVARMPPSYRDSICHLVTLLIPVPLLRVVPWFRDAVDIIVHRLGGLTRLECGAALFLLGFVWGSPRKSFSPAFLGIVSCLVGLIVLSESAGHLVWRSAAPAMWSNTPGADDCIKQSTGLTCSPAATVMLAQRYGINTSEGELAYLSNTSLLGTSAASMANALNGKLKGTGLQAMVCQGSYDRFLSRRISFVAHVDLPGLGGHALFVRRMTENALEVVDPRFGVTQKMSRSEFERIWNGTGLVLDWSHSDFDSAWGGEGLRL